MNGMTMSSRNYRIKKNYLYKRYLINKTVYAKSNYHKIRNKYFHLLEQKKQNYYQQLLLKYNAVSKTPGKLSTPYWANQK